MNAKCRRIWKKILEIRDAEKDNVKLQEKEAGLYKKLAWAIRGG